MNKSTMILIAFVAIGCLVIVSYGNQKPFIIIENPTGSVVVDPVFSIVVKDANGNSIDWDRDETVVSGILTFDLLVTNAATADVKPIALVYFEVEDIDPQSTTYLTIVGTWTIPEVVTQTEYALDWDTNDLDNGLYELRIRYTLTESPQSPVLAFSMFLDTNDIGTVDIGLLNRVQVDYVIPLLAVLIIGAGIVYIVLRTRR